MRAIVVSALAGALLGAGLWLSGMGNPANVRAFLDVGGQWESRLLWVMAMAVLVAAPAFHFATRRGRSLCGDALCLPPRQGIRPRLVAGSLVFGIGWGIAGICPGPALLLAGQGVAGGVLFLLAMLAGMWLTDAVTARRQAA